MAATNRENAIESENEAPRLDDSKLATSTAEEGDMEEFYEKVQHVVDELPRGDVLYVIGDSNAKVGQDEINGTTGRFGLGERNERGDQLVELCSRNDFQILNTFFKLHARRLYTERSPDQTTRN